MAGSYRAAMVSSQASRGTSPSRSFWLTLPQSTISRLRSPPPSTTHSPYSMFSSSSHFKGAPPSRCDYRSQLGSSPAGEGSPLGAASSGPFFW